MANKFTLKGHHIEVEYSLGGNPSFTALTYKDASISLDLKPAQITVDQTALGSLISFPLERPTDAGGKTFAFFLPNIGVSHGQTADFTAVAIREEFSGPDSGLHRPTIWHSFIMQGTAGSEMMPL